MDDNLMYKEEKEWFKRNVKDKVVLEIGTYKGLGTKLMLDSGAEQVTSIDIFNPQLITSKGGKDEYIPLYEQEKAGLNVAWENLSSYNNRILIAGDSGSVLPLLQDQLFDIVFIDGEHSYEGVHRDFMESSRLVKVGGLLCFHDNEDRFPGIQKQIKEVQDFFGQSFVLKEQIKTLTVFEAI